MAMLSDLLDALPACEVCRHPLEASGRIVAPHYECPFCGADQ